MKASIDKSSWAGKNNPNDKPCDGAVWDETSKQWFVEVKIIDDILDIASSLVISASNQEDDFDLYIEIYDDWLE